MKAQSQQKVEPYMGLVSAAFRASVSQVGRIELLDVCRESRAKAYRNFADLANVTALMNSHLAAVREVAAAGMAPMMCESSFTIIEEATGETLEVPVHIERMGRVSVRVFVHGGVGHVWALTSAAALNAADNMNGFTELLGDILDVLKPRTVAVAVFSRLVRDQDHGTRLQDRLVRAQVERVQVGSGGVIALQGDGGVGKALFGFYAMNSASEREQIVRRLSGGKLHRVRKGQWPYSAANVPFGYSLDAESGRVVLVESLRPLVREMLVALGSGDQPKRIVERLSELGVMQRRPDPRSGVLRGVGEGSSHRQTVQTLRALAPLYALGEGLYVVGGSIRDAVDVAGVPVVRWPDEPDPFGELQMLYRVPLPEGGWAEAEVLERLLDAAVVSSRGRSPSVRSFLRPLGQHVVSVSRDPLLWARLTQPDSADDADDAALEVLGDEAGVVPVALGAPRGGRSHDLVPPFSGWGWDDGVFHYELVGAGPSRGCVIWRWPLRAAAGDVKARPLRAAAGDVNPIEVFEPAGVSAAPLSGDCFARRWSA